MALRQTEPVSRHWFPHHGATWLAPCATAVSMGRKVQPAAHLIGGHRPHAAVLTICGSTGGMVGGQQIVGDELDVMRPPLFRPQKAAGIGPCPRGEPRLQGDGKVLPRHFFGV
jgi:hypothetical protein